MNLREFLKRGLKPQNTDKLSAGRRIQNLREFLKRGLKQRGDINDRAKRAVLRLNLREFLKRGLKQLKCECVLRVWYSIES